MANSFSYQILKDDTQHAIIKLTAAFDGSGQEENIARIQANTLYGALDANNVPLRSALSVSNTAKPYYGLTIFRLWYDTDTGSGDVQLYWRANNQAGVLANTGVPIMFLQGNGEYDGNGNWVTIKNPNITANTNGDISISTRGQSTNSSYTIIMELRKDNAYYQRGQFNDPAAFNYGDYSLKP
jgi:hypothetical protein